MKEEFKGIKYYDIKKKKKKKSHWILKENGMSQVTSYRMITISSSMDDQ